MNAGSEQQRVDIVFELPVRVREHRQNGELCSVRAAKVRSHVLFGSKTGSLHGHVSMVLNLCGGNRHLRRGWSLRTGRKEYKDGEKELSDLHEVKLPRLARI